MDSDGTFAYEGGGYSFSVGDNINEFGKFDPVANTWTPLAPVPDLTNAEASGVYAPNVNKLFVFGGDSPNTGTVVNTTRIYDIATNTWSTGAPMPDVRAFMASGYFNGKIYLVGGYSTGNITPAFLQTWEYDPVANTFATKTRCDGLRGCGLGGGQRPSVRGRRPRCQRHHTRHDVGLRHCGRHLDGASQPAHRRQRARVSCDRGQAMDIRRWQSVR
jgi:Galactose oxidase, central domain